MKRGLLVGTMLALLYLLAYQAGYQDGVGDGTSQVVHDEARRALDEAAAEQEQQTIQEWRKRFRQEESPVL